MKNLVALHGGTVSARSEGVGRGSEFVVRLPMSVSDNPMVRSDPSPILLPVVSSRRRVLVVDDNIDAGNLLCEVLRSAGHEVVIVHDPFAALEAVERFAPEVAVLDIGLPRMDGYELAAKMQSSATAATCRLLALTGYGQEPDRVRSEQAGFAGHLVKPVDVAALLRAIDS